MDSIELFLLPLRTLTKEINLLVKELKRLTEARTKGEPEKKNNPHDGGIKQ